MEDSILEIEKIKFDYGQSIIGPKIIFISGSSVRFGVDSDEIAEELNISVVNYGLSARLGIDLIVARAIELIKPNDIVVYAPEWIVAEPGPNPLRNKWLKLYGNTYHSDFFPEQPVLDTRLRWKFVHSKTLAFLRGQQNFLWQSLRSASGQEKMLPNPYSPEAFNESGNLTMRPDGYRVPPNQWQTPPGAPRSTKPLAKTMYGTLNRLHQATQESDATLVVMTAIQALKGGWEPHFPDPIKEDWINHVRAKGIPILLDSRQTVFDLNYAYDSQYHLNDEGVAILSSRLVDALRPYVENLKP